MWTALLNQSHPVRGLSILIWASWRVDRALTWSCSAVCSKTQLDWPSNGKPQSLSECLFPLQHAAIPIFERPSSKKNVFTYSYCTYKYKGYDTYFQVFLASLTFLLETSQTSWMPDWLATLQPAPRCSGSVGTKHAATLADMIRGNHGVNCCELFWNCHMEWNCNVTYCENL